MEDDFDAPAFIQKVKAMRKAQKDYFRTRLPSILTEAKGREREADQLIAAWEDGDKPKQAALLG